MRVTMGGSEKAGRASGLPSDVRDNVLRSLVARAADLRELPMLYNQWCSVIRWEKTTRPFLRSRESSGGRRATIHETAEGGHSRDGQQLNCYADFFENVLAIPRRTRPEDRKEKFAGAEATYTVECLHEGSKGAAGRDELITFGDKFSRSLQRDLYRPRQQATVSVPDLLGAPPRDDRRIIMAHGDNNGPRPAAQDRPPIRSSSCPLPCTRQAFWKRPRN